VVRRSYEGTISISQGRYEFFFKK